MCKVRKDNLKLFTIFLMAIILSGCATAYRPADIFTNDKINSMEESICPSCNWRNPFTWVQQAVLEEPIAQINPYDFQINGKNLYNEASQFNSDCHPLTSPTKLGRAEIARNELTGTAIMLADSAMSKHLASIKSTETNVNLLLGAATAGLTGGATVAGVTGAKVLSAAATGTNAAQSMFNENTYRNALSETLIGSVESDREIKRKEILDRLTKECISSYPVSVALADVQNYLNGGSFYHGLALIREAAEAANAKRRGQDEPLSKAIYDNYLNKLKLEEATTKSKILELEVENQKKSDSLKPKVQ